MGNVNPLLITPPLLVWQFKREIISVSENQCKTTFHPLIFFLQNSPVLFPNVSFIGKFDLWQPFKLLGGGCPKIHGFWWTPKPCDLVGPKGGSEDS